MTPSFSHPRMAALSIALGAAFPALAQTSAPASELRETVVTANRSEQLLTDALPHTTVIGRDAIERSQAVDLASLLAGEAGFQSVQNGGRGSATSLFLRGSAAMQVLVMIDGVPLTKQDTTGTVSLEHIMLDSIERVEIVRGNVSAIYGSGAVGGVIQLFTRKGQGKPAGYAQLEAGSFSTVRAAAGVGGQVGDTRFALGIGGHRTTGISAIDVAQHPGENPDLDGYRNVNVNLSVSHLLAPGQTIGFRAQGTQGRFDTDGGGWGSATDVYKGSSALGNGSLYSHNQITADWRSELTYSQGREKSLYDATLTAYPYDSQATSRSRTLNWTNTVALRGWQLTAGAERQLQSIDTSDSYATTLNTSRDVTALFAGVSGTSGPHALQLNVRNDAVSGMASQTTGYAGYGYQLTPAWKLIATVSSAFNLPPLGYLYDPFSGNPQLQPETARSGEMGLQWAEGTQVMRATLFSTQTDNLMLYDFNTFRFENVTKATNKGLEVSFNGKLSAADVRASLTAQDPVDDSTGAWLPRRARPDGVGRDQPPLGRLAFRCERRLHGQAARHRPQSHVARLLGRERHGALCREPGNRPYGAHRQSVRPQVPDRLGLQPARHRRLCGYRLEPEVSPSPARASPCPTRMPPPTQPSVVQGRPSRERTSGGPGASSA
jgi:vitamin B12 transporter